MQDLIGIFMITLILVACLYGIEKITRTVLGVKKESNSDFHVNKLHANLHTLLIVILFVLIFVNDTYNFVGNITAIIIFALSLFTFRSLMQKIYLKGSKEYLITLVTGVITTGIVGVAIYFLV